ncbi:MAG: hypothetical protein AAGA75_02880 [Cyanobacteria bacterium P01_E01_bin.6]
MMLGGGAIAPPPNTLVVYWDTAWSLYDLEPEWLRWFSDVSAMQLLYRT